ncbi:MAG: Na-translocating system protein MpsC family protein [Caldilineaceae bacterium]
MTVAVENALAQNFLPEIAQLFLAEWKRLRDEPGQTPEAKLRTDLLTVEIHNALTAREKSMAQTEAGRNVVTRMLDRWIELAYPRLASQIERQLNCYVTWTGIDVEPDNGCVRVRIGLRESALVM